jgi:hypothetical protein
VPTLNIEGRKVSVDDSFLKLSPEQQNATVEEIASSFKTPASDRIRVTPADQPQRLEAPAAPGMAEDVARSAGSGVVSGAAMFAGGAGDLRNLLSHGVSYAAEKLGIPSDKVEQFKTLVHEGATRASPVTAMMANAPTTEDVSRLAGGEAGDRNMVGQAMDYKPTTKAGEYAKTAGEFLPAAFGGGGGLIARGARVLVPAVSSEAAGQLTKGTKGEPVARFLAALAGGGITALASRPGTATRALSQQLPDGITEGMVNQADRLMQDAAQRGIQLAWPEALSQVAGRPVLTNMMRHLEASPQTERQMGEFFAGRPQAVEGAVRGELDNIAPVNRAPSTIGPDVGKSFENTVRDLEKARTKATSPHYEAANQEHVPGPEVQKLVDNIDAAIGSDKTGIVGGALKEIRNLLVSRPAEPAIPPTRVARVTPNGKIYDTTPGKAAVPESYITDIENLDRVRKYVRDKMDMPQIGQDAITKEQGANITRAIDDLKARMLAASENFRAGKALHQEITEKYLKPVMDGPIGKLADRDTTTRKAIDTLFPKNPLPNSEQEISTAVSALSKRNPKAAGDLVRAHAESTFNEAARDLQTGPNQANGAKFRVAIAGNPQQRANLQAAVEALPNGQQRWQGFERLLDVLEATGTRQNVGSRTAYNAEINKAQGAGGLVRDATKIVGNPAKLAQPLIDKYEQWKLGRNLSQLADILTDPRSADLLRGLARVPRGEWGRAAAVASKIVTYAEASRPDRLYVSPSRQVEQPRNQ